MNQLKAKKMRARWEIKWIRPESKIGVEDEVYDICIIESVEANIAQIKIQKWNNLHLKRLRRRFSSQMEWSIILSGKEEQKPRYKSTSIFAPAVAFCKYQVSKLEVMYSD